MLHDSIKAAPARESAHVAEARANGLHPVRGHAVDLAPRQTGADDLVRRRRGCEVCGRPARVHILENYGHGQPIIRRFCLHCALENPRPVPVPEQAAPRTRITALIALVGVAIGVLGVLGDTLTLESHAGFGWFQRLGVFVGALIVFVATLLRADLIALGGIFIVMGSLCADWFGLARAPGIGWKQQALLACSGACLMLALLGRIRSNHARRRARLLARDAAGENHDADCQDGVGLGQAPLVSGK